MFSRFFLVDFLKLGKLYAFEHEHNFEQVHEIWRNRVTWMKQFFRFVEKKNSFPVCDSIFVFNKKI